MVSLPVALDYNAVNIIRRAWGVKSTPELWSKLSVIEAEYVTISHEKYKREK